MFEEIKTFEERKKDLINLGKKKGIITYEELAEHLKGLELDADSLDDLYNALSENHINVVSENEDDEEDAGNTSNELLTKDLTINLVLFLTYSWLLPAEGIAGCPDCRSQV